MKQIPITTSLAFPHTLTKQTDTTFIAPQNSLYALFISARAQSEKQRGEHETDDADLTLGFNGIPLHVLSPKGKLMRKDTPIAFSGGKLHNRKKTVVLVLKLPEGEHTLNVYPEHTPTLERINIYQLDKEDNLTIPIEEQAEDGDRRPFYTFGLFNLPITSITIDATITRRFFDSDDIQILVNHRLKTRLIPKLPHSKWKLWLWIGAFIESIVNTPLRETRILDLNLQKGLHTIEVHADRMPIIHSMQIRISGQQDEHGDPVKIAEEFNPEYILTDTAFNNNQSMTEEEIQSFLDSHHLIKAQPHIATIVFEGYRASYWVKKMADQHALNPKLLLTKLQAEQRLIKGDKAINPTQKQLDGALGVGMRDDGVVIEELQGFVTQVTYAAQYFRQYYEEAPQVHFTHTDVDGQTVATINSATYTLYKYTPHVDGARLVYDVYEGFFGTTDLGGVLKVGSQEGGVKVFYVLLATFFMVGATVGVYAYFATHALYSFQERILFGNGLVLATELKIFSEKAITVEEGAYCGTRFNKLYEANARALLLQDGNVVHAIALTLPELVVKSVRDIDTGFYTFWDIDGDGKKQEFVVQEYASCNGNMMSFVRVNEYNSDFERIPIVRISGKENFSIFVSHAPNSFTVNKGTIRVRYYDNTQGEFFESVYAYDKEVRKLLEKGTHIDA